MSLHHQLFIIDAELKAPLEFEKRKEITRKLIDEVMIRLKMEELGPLEIYDATDPKYPGWSFIQPITTSHISGHYFAEKDKASHIHIDIYSCNAFDSKSVIAVLDSHLKMGSWIGNQIMRNQDEAKRENFLIKGFASVIE